MSRLRSKKASSDNIVKYNVTNKTKEVIDSFDEFEGKTVSLAGRLMAKRGMGKFDIFFTCYSIVMITYFYINIIT